MTVNILQGLDSLRATVEGFKKNHKNANKAITGFISALPSPFDKFCDVIWQGLEDDDDSAEKMLAVLEKIREDGERNHLKLEHDISRLIRENASKEDIQKIGEQIRTSNEPVLSILESSLPEIKQRLVSMQLDLKAMMEIQRPEDMSDELLFQKLRMAFDRPAFKAPWSFFSGVEDFKEVIKDTIGLVNSGVLEKNGVVIYRAKGKALIKNQEWFDMMDDLEKRLDNIKNLIGDNSTQLSMSQRDIQTIIDEREKIIGTLNEIWSALGIRPIRLISDASDVNPYDLQDTWEESKMGPEPWS